MCLFSPSLLFLQSVFYVSQALVSLLLPGKINLGLTEPLAFLSSVSPCSELGSVVSASTTCEFPAPAAAGLLKPPNPLVSTLIGAPAG